MTRLIKDGVVRLVENQADIDMYKELGYAQTPESPEKPNEASGVLEKMTVQELVKMCEDNGIEVPKPARKADLIELLQG